MVYLETALATQLLHIEWRTLDGVVTQLACRLKNADTAAEQILILSLALHVCTVVVSEELMAIMLIGR